MNRSSSTFDKIEDFLANRLSTEDHSAFAKEITINPKLQLEVERHRVLRDVLRDKKTLNFKRNLQSIQQEFYEEENEGSVERQKSFFKYWKIAAVGILLLGISGTVWYNLTPKDTMQDVYIAYYTPYPITSDIRSQTEEDWKTIVQEYAMGNYNKVVSVFETLNTIPLTDEMRLCIGNSYLQIHQEQKAIELFMGIPNDSGFYEDGLWYLALTYVKMKDSKNATAILERIIVYNGKYQSKAIALKNNMNR